VSKQSASDVPTQREIKPDKAAIRARVAFESERRPRLGVPSFAGGFLFLLGGITVSATLKALPTVGVIQVVAPALRGEANPSVGPGAAEVKFISHHAVGLIAGNALQALAILFIVLVLLFLLDAVTFRRPQTSRIAKPLVLLGGAVMVLVSVAHPVAQVVDAHNFITGHDFSSAAVNRALTRSSVLEVTQYLGLLGGLVLTAGMIVVVLGAFRTGLLPRWMMILGAFMAVLAFTPFGLALGEVQQLIPAFWMVAMGLLMMGRWPGGDPPAWPAGEARPWPSPAQVRAERDAQRAESKSSPGKGDAKRAQNVSPEPAQRNVAPEPVQPVSGANASGKRRRKRGSRQ
jgi:hypothetical protein